MSDKFFWPKFFLTQIFFQPKNVWSKFYFDQQKFWPKNFFWPKFFLSHIFLSGQNNFDPNFFGQIKINHKLFWTKKILDKKNWPNFSWFWIWILGPGIQELGFRICDLGFGIWDSGSGTKDLVSRLLLTNWPFWPIGCGPALSDFYLSKMNWIYENVWLWGI